MSTFYSLPATGEAVSLFTHLVVREDAHTLYGFGTLEERSAFRQLIRISGVGARTALAVLSGLSVSDLARAVTLQDAAPLTRIPGIGKKTAERLLLELKGKLAEAPRQPARRPAGLRCGERAGRPRLQRQGSAGRGKGPRARHAGRRGDPRRAQDARQVLSAAAMLGALIALPASALSEEPARGWYIGADLGQASFADEDDTAFKLLGGYRINRHLAAEGAYAWLFDKNGAEVTAFELVALGSCPLASQLSVLGKLGLANVYAEGPTIDAEKVELTYGIGIQYDMTRRSAFAASGSATTAKRKSISSASASSGGSEEGPELSHLAAVSCARRVAFGQQRSRFSLAKRPYCRFVLLCHRMLP